MPPPRTLEAYPSNMVDALNHALQHGTLVIPCPVGSQPSAAYLRLQFYGLFRCLRAAKLPELPDALSVRVSSTNDAVIISLREKTPLALAIDAAIEQALTAASPSIEPARENSPEATLQRIINGA